MFCFSQSGWDRGTFWSSHKLFTTCVSNPSVSSWLISTERSKNTSSEHKNLFLHISFCFGFSEYRHFHHRFPMQRSKSCINIPEMETGPMLPVFYRVRPIDFSLRNQLKEPIKYFFFSHCNRVEHNLCVFLPNQTELQNMATFSKTPPSSWEVVNLLWRSSATTWRSLQETSHGGSIFIPRFAAAVH